jgi:hypothetical protein
MPGLWHTPEGAPSTVVEKDFCPPLTGFFPGFDVQTMTGDPRLSETTTNQLITLYYNCS